MSTEKVRQDAADIARPDVATPARTHRTDRRRTHLPGNHAAATIPDEELTPRVRTVVSTLIEEVERLRRDLAISQRQVAELATMADCDPLLGVLNRRAFRRELTRAIAHARRYVTTLSVIYLDLDGFKAINDRFGHAAGDAVLRHVGETLEGSVRQSDIVGRLGGDEFAVVLVQAGLAAAERKAALLAAAVAAGRMDGGDQGVAVSTGVAELAAGDTADSLLERADDAMYRGKPGGLRR